MCGIAGYWNYRSQRPARSEILGRMIQALRHRGPDDDGMHVEGSLGLAATRLSIVDLEHGDQPMANECGSIVAVFNGEIYNHAALRENLESKGHRFRTRCDTEVLVRAFEEWGIACARNFDGMFAFAVWDRGTNELTLARDQLGIKPLYVCDALEGVLFASELKAILATGLVAAEVDLDAVDDFLTYEYVPAPGCIVRGVRKLLPGSYLRYHTRMSVPPPIRQFWLPTPGAHPSTQAEASEEIHEAVRKSVRLRMVADVKIGTFLSGGLDSSIIAATMAREGAGRIRTFSVGFREAGYDESAYARLMVDQIGSTHCEDYAVPATRETVMRIADAFDEPFADVSAFSTLQVSELARRHVTVALSGDGGDELFAGYDVYRAHRWASRLRRFSGTASWDLVERLIERAPPAASKKGPVNVAKRFVEALHRPEDLEHARWWVFWDLSERRALYAPEMRASLGGRDCFAHYRNRLEEGRERGLEGLNRQLYADITGYLADDILVKLDRMSMLVSLEARVPYLDPALVEYTLGLPAHWKLRGERGKWILKKAFDDEIPAAIRTRRKQGFSVPLKNWIRGPLFPLMAELLDERRIRDRGWFDHAEVGRLLSEHVRGRANHAHRLWCLATLELSMQAIERRAALGQRPLEAAAR